MEKLKDNLAEAGIIATVIQNPNFVDYSENLKHTYFTDELNRVIYWAVVNLRRKNVERVDEISLRFQMDAIPEGKEVLDRCGEKAIREIVENSPLISRTKDEYVEFVTRVQDLAEKRELYKKLSMYANLIEQDKVVAGDVVRELNSTTNEIHNSYIDDSDLYIFTNHVDDLWKSVVEKRNDDGSFGLPSKFPIFNKYFSYEKGELVLISARAKAGKSLLGLNETYHQLKQGKTVVYFDTEMKPDNFFTRLLSHITGIPESIVKSGGYDKNSEMLIKEAKDWIKKQKFTYINDFNWNTDKIYTKLKMLKNYFGDIDLFVYDYIKNNSKNYYSASDNYNYLGQLCNFLKNDVAVGLDIPVLSFAQLNRENNIADSDQISRYLSTQIQWSAKSKDEIMKDGAECGNYKATILLNRNGEQMDIEDYIDFNLDRDSLNITVAKKQHIDIPEEFRSNEKGRKYD